MAVELTFSRNSKDVLAEFSDRRITECGEVTYSHDKKYTLQKGDRPWLKSVVEAILNATDHHDVAITIRPYTISIVTRKAISDLDRSKFENAVKAAIQQYGLPVAVEV